MTEFNPQQQEAIDSDERTIVCLASAGCGKTKTLIGRTERLIKDGVDPKSILALTFTNAAAFEMKERFKLSPNFDPSKGTPEFRTFHSFCYSLIIKDPAIRKKLGYSKVPEICDDNKLKEIRTKVKLQLNCKLSDKQLEDSEAILSRADKETKELFNKALLREIKQQNVITFDIMCYNVCELFTRDDPVSHPYKQKYKHVLVDEMQDCDPRQYRFVGSFTENTSIFLVGDVLQAIYFFRGCSNKFLKQLISAPGWKVIKMYKNYRSTSTICDYVNKFSKYSKDEYRIEMEGQRGEGPAVKTIYGSSSNYNDPVDTNHLAELIDMLRANKVETAILCRTNKECACVREALEDAGIEFSSSHKSTDAINYLNGALDNECLIEWLSSLLDTKDYGDYIRLSSQNANPDIHWFMSMYGNRSKIQKVCDKVKQIRTIASGNDTPANKFEKITKLLRINSKCDFEKVTEITNKKLVEEIRDQMEDYEENKIYVGTIHSSKGLEYESVYVMGVDDYMFELGNEEMDNLFYVAITRAKKYLTIFRR